MKTEAEGKKEKYNKLLGTAMRTMKMKYKMWLNSLPLLAAGKSRKRVNASIHSITRSKEGRRRKKKICNNSLS